MDIVEASRAAGPPEIHPSIFHCQTPNQWNFGKKAQEPVEAQLVPIELMASKNIECNHTIQVLFQHSLQSDLHGKSSLPTIDLHQKQVWGWEFHKISGKKGSFLENHKWGGWIFLMIWVIQNPQREPATFESLKRCQDTPPKSSHHFPSSSRRKEKNAAWSLPEIRAVWAGEIPGGLTQLIQPESLCKSLQHETT